MKEVIGFIGVGVMGSSMVGHLLARGYSVVVYTRTKEKAQEVLEKGAEWADSPKEVAQKATIILTIVGYPSDVEEVYFGENGLFQGLEEGSLVIDLTTSTPSLAEKIYVEAKSHGIGALDAPVSGGDIGAKKGTLTTMIGGDDVDVKRALPVLDSFSATIVHQGKAGAGQHTKMANQIMIAGTMTGMTEMLVYAKKAGLDVQKVFETVSGGSAANWSLANYAPRIFAENYSPGFFAKHFLKDLTIALEEANRMEVELPATKQAQLLYKQLVEQGYGDDGTQALIKLWW